MKVVLDVETNSINPKENDILIFPQTKHTLSKFLSFYITYIFPNIDLVKNIKNS